MGCPPLGGFVKGLPRAHARDRLNGTFVRVWPSDTGLFEQEFHRTQVALRVHQ